MSKRVAIYTRVSTQDQNLANQLIELRDKVMLCGWSVTAVFEDKMSGAKDRSQRPGLDALLRGVAKKSFDVVAVWAVDRLGRSLSDLLMILTEIHSKNVGLYIHTSGIDTTTPAGRAMFSILGTFAEFERSILSERVKIGLSRARAEGKQCGRPRIGTAMEEKIRKARAKGKGIRRVARELGIGVSVVQRVTREIVREHR